MSPLIRIVKNQLREDIGEEAFLDFKSKDKLFENIQDVRAKNLLREIYQLFEDTEWGSEKEEAIFNNYQSPGK